MTTFSKRVLAVFAVLALIVPMFALAPNSVFAARTWPTQRLGDSGENVITIQAFLRKRGYTVNYNGSFDTSTDTAVKSFQSANALTSDGIVGPATWEKLAMLTSASSTYNIAAEALQRQLKNKYGFSTLTVDGLYGGGTTSAVTSFQSSKCLAADGVAGLDTWAALTSGTSSCGTGGGGSSGTLLTDSQARQQLAAAGITSIVSSGNCSNRQNSTCTSLDQIRQGTISGIIRFKQNSGCSITITGGTEVGHSSGTYSHYNGYKLDISPTTCVSNYITANYPYIGTRSGDGAAQYKDSYGATSIYARESNHWDILYY